MFCSHDTETCFYNSPLYPIFKFCYFKKKISDFSGEKEAKFNFSLFIISLIFYNEVKFLASVLHTSPGNIIKCNDPNMYCIYN